MRVMLVRQCWGSRFFQRAERIVQSTQSAFSGGDGVPGGAVVGILSEDFAELHKGFGLSPGLKQRVSQGHAEKAVVGQLCDDLLVVLCGRGVLAELRQQISEIVAQHPIIRRGDDRVTIDGGGAVEVLRGGAGRDVPCSVDRARTDGRSVPAGR